MKNKKYACKECGCKEFITTPNQYDVFLVEKGKLVFQSTESVDDEMELFCRDCSEELTFDEKDIVM